MNSNHTIFSLAGWLLLGVAVIPSGCREDNNKPSLKDVSDRPQYLNGLKPHAEYIVQEAVFYRVYEGKASLHPPYSLWCDFSIDDYTNGRVTNQYVKGIIQKGTRVRFDRALVNNLSTHTVILYYADVLGGEHQGEEVLINSLADNLPTWLVEASSGASGGKRPTGALIDRSSSRDKLGAWKQHRTQQ